MEWSERTISVPDRALQRPDYPRYFANAHARKISVGRASASCRPFPLRGGARRGPARRGGRLRGEPVADGPAADGAADTGDADQAHGRGAALGRVGRVGARLARPRAEGPV